MENIEFVCKFKNGSYDWIDPIQEVIETKDLLIVVAKTGYEYALNLIDVDQWVVREYDGENVFPFEEEYK